ncbi:MAG: TIGR04076 family protein [Eubacterium sp.]|nr:TIGR04076 family protein [Eubacterium sp.]
MQYKCKVTVIDKKCFTEYQEEYLKNPQAGACPFYQVGDEFIFERYGGEDTFWLTGDGTQCGEAWDCISRYIYTALQGGSIMRGWTNDERMMIACCNDGTRPVIFKIQRMDYKVVKIQGMTGEYCVSQLKRALRTVHGVEHVDVRLDKNWAEVFVGQDADVSDEALRIAVEQFEKYSVVGID